MPCSFGLLPRRRSGTGSLPNGLLEVTVSIRWTPLVTAAYGTWVARPARTTMLALGGDDFRLGGRVRTVLGNEHLVGKSPEGSWRLGDETQT